jgi:hypothetical protein
LTITVDSDLVLTPVFEKVKYNLTVNIEGQGTVRQEIISAGKSSEDFSSGSVVRLIADPSADHAVYNWNKDILDTINPIEVIIDGNKVVDAKFDYKPEPSLLQ